MTPEAKRENVACEAVVIGFKALLAQHGTAEPILQLCDELAGRIALRRHLPGYRQAIDAARAGGEEG